MANRVYETAIRIGAALSSTFGATSAKAAQALKALSGESKRLGAEGRAAAREVAKITKAGGDASAAIAEQKRLAAALEEVRGKIKAVNEAQAARGRLFTAGAGVASSAKSLVSDAAKVAGAAAAAGFGIFELAKHTADYGDSIDDASKRIGIGSEALQALRLQGELSGASIEEVDNSLGKLAVNIGKVISTSKKGGPSGLVGNVGEIQLFGKEGGGAAAAKTDPFAHIGLSARKLAQLKPDEQVDRIADAIAKLKTHAEKAAAAQAIFGKAGIKILPALEDGSAGLRKMREEGIRTGQFLSKDGVQNASDFNDALRIAKGAIGGVVRTLGAELLPVGIRVLKDLTRYVSENRGQIKAWAENAARFIEKKAIPAFVKIGPEVLRIAEKIGALIDKAAKLAGGFDNLGIAIVALRAAPLVKSLGDMGGALIEYIAKTVRATAATKGLQAAQAAGGGTGGGGSAGGQAGAVIGAALAGYTAGTALDQEFNLSGRAANYLAGLEDLNRRGFQGGAGATFGRLEQFFKERSVDTGENAGGGAAVERLRAGQAIQFSPTYNVGKGSREDIEKQLDEQHAKAKAELLASIDAREEERRRVSFR